MIMTYGEAIREALYLEMKANPEVVMFGQDIQHNLYGYTKGLVTEFGDNRVRDTPLSEAAVAGTAIGASMCGMRVIVDLTVSSFIYVAMDQIVNMASKTIYMYGGQYKVPLTIMCSSMYNCSNGAQHSDRSHPMLMNVPGIKIVTPGSAQDAYSLLRASITDDSPVIFYADRSIFYNKMDVDLEKSVKFGSANVLVEGESVTIIAISGMVQMVLSIVETLKSEGVSPEVIDVRTLVPLDKNSILNSVRKTGRVVIVDSANRTGSAASEIASVIAEHGFDYLKAPIGIIAYDDVPIPFSKDLETILMPSAAKIISKAREICRHGYKSI